MCTPSPPKPTTIPERQALKQPDSGATDPTVDDEIRRRRALMPTAWTGAATLGAGPSTTSTTLGA